MATKKKAAAPAAKKPASQKAPAASNVKKAVPAKPQPKAAPKKAVKPAPNKKAVDKPAAKKPLAKPVARAAAKPAPNSKPAAKPVAKAIPLKVASKKVAAKPAANTAPKPAVKVAPKKTAAPVKNLKTVTVNPVAEKTPPVAKPASIHMAKKTEDKKPIEKVVAKPAGIPKASDKNLKDVKAVPAKPVVIPKTNTKTARKYQPDFTKSVLDQPINDPGASIIRYSDSDLTEFRELIQRKLGAAKKELSYLQGLITRKDDMGGDEGDNRYMTMEDGSLSMEREQLSQMASRQITFIDHLEKALMRIENKTYGICRVTGKLIDKARLRAVPHATLSIEAKMCQR